MLVVPGPGVCSVCRREGVCEVCVGGRECVEEGIRGGKRMRRREGRENEER